MIFNFAKTKTLHPCFKALGITRQGTMSCIYVIVSSGRLDVATARGFISFGIGWEQILRIGMIIFALYTQHRIWTVHPDSAFLSPCSRLSFFANDHAFSICEQLICHMALPNEGKLSLLSPLVRGRLGVQKYPALVFCSSLVAARAVHVAHATRFLLILCALVSTFYQNDLPTIASLQPPFQTYGNVILVWFMQKLQSKGKSVNTSVYCINWYSFLSLTRQTMEIHGNLEPGLLTLNRSAKIIPCLTLTETFVFRKSKRYSI